MVLPRMYNRLLVIGWMCQICGAHHSSTRLDMCLFLIIYKNENPNSCCCPHQIPLREIQMKKAKEKENECINVIVKILLWLEDYISFWLSGYEGLIIRDEYCERGNWCMEGNTLLAWECCWLICERSLDLLYGGALILIWCLNLKESKLMEV